MAKNEQRGKKRRKMARTNSKIEKKFAASVIFLSATWQLVVVDEGTKNDAIWQKRCIIA